MPGQNVRIERCNSRVFSRYSKLTDVHNVISRFRSRHGHHSSHDAPDGIPTVVSAPRNLEDPALNPAI